MKYNRPVPIAKIIYGAGLILMGIITVISENPFGFIFIGISLYFFRENGIEIDLDNKKYRNIFSIFGLTYGQWENLPDIEYVSVFKTDITTRVWVSTASTNITNTVIKVNLFYNTNKKIEAYETENIDDAFEKAKEIATVLNVDILDATERESKWL